MAQSSHTTDPPSRYRSPWLKRGLAAALLSTAFASLGAAAQTQVPAYFTGNVVIECGGCAEQVTLVIQREHLDLVDWRVQMSHLPYVPEWATGTGRVPMPRNPTCKRLKTLYTQTTQWAQQYHSYYVALSLGADYRVLAERGPRDFATGSARHSQAKERFQEAMLAAFKTSQRFIDAAIESGCISKEGT